MQGQPCARTSLPCGDLCSCARADTSYGHILYVGVLRVCGGCARKGAGHAKEISELQPLSDPCCAGEDGAGGKEELLVAASQPRIGQAEAGTLPPELHPLSVSPARGVCKVSRVRLIEFTLRGASNKSRILYGIPIT